MVATLLSLFAVFKGAMATERSFIMVKPDGVSRGLVGEIVKRFEQRGFKLVAMKFMKADAALLNQHYGAHIGKPFFDKLMAYISMGPVVPMAEEDLLKQHYGDLKAKPFFSSLVKFIGSGPVVPMVWEGKGVVATGRVMLGETDPQKSKPGTIRGDFCLDMGRNICHGSDSVESANKEIALWFKDAELVSWTPVGNPMVYE